MTVNHKFHTTPYAHQVEALDRSIDRPYYGFLMEMGAGKSKVLIDTIANLYLEGKLDFALVIAPKGVYQNWVNKEIPEHLSPDIPLRLLRWVAQPTVAQKKELSGLKFPFDGLTILVMNIEAFSSPRGRAAGEWLAKQWGRKGLIGIDESTKIKNHKAQRTKALCNIGRGFTYRRILTGSPITKEPMDIFAQAQFLQPGLLGPSFYAFQARYAVLRRQVMGAHSFDKVVGYQRLEELSDRIAGFSYRVLKKDCLDLPEKSYTVREVELSPEQVKAYDELRRLAQTEIEGDSVTAPRAITLMLRLQQVLCGYVGNDEGEISPIPSLRLETLMDILEEVSGKVIIWSRFRADIIAITQALKERYGDDAAASYFGDTRDAERARVVREFQTPEHPLRFFIGNAATAGYGITLTEASTVIYYANSFDLEHRIQSEDRAHRVGQKNPVLYIDLLTPDTIDEKIVAALRNKIDLSSKVLKEEARQWLELKPKTKKN